jgi:sugar porter (SP) family MFS transporter
MAAETAMTHARGEDAGAPRLNSLLVLTAVASAISGFLYGYDTGIVSGALLQIRRDFDTGSGTEQVIAASILAGAVIGALVGGQLSERWGRHKTILLIAIIFVVGTLASSLAPSAITLSLARIVLGFAVGAATQTVPMFVAELSPAKYRGRLVLTFQVAIGVGILVATIVGATELFSWRLMVGMAAVPAAVLFCLMLPLPESPRWLVKVDRLDDARANLARVRTGGDLDAELREIQEVEEEERKAPRRGFDGLRQPWVRPALVVGVGIAIFTQLSGIEMIIYYTPTILTDIGFTETGALRVSVALAVTYLVMMLIGFSIIDRVGRRRLTLIMIPGAALALAVLGSVFVVGGDNADTAWLLITCLIVFMVFNAGGLQLMGWLTGSEVYPLAVRGAGTSVQSASLWGSNMLITLTLLTMINAIGVGPSMWVYALFNVAAWIFVFRKFPELNGRSLEDIERALRKGSFKPGGVAVSDDTKAAAGA